MVQPERKRGNALIKGVRKVKDTVVHRAHWNNSSRSLNTSFDESDGQSDSDGNEMPKPTSSHSLPTLLDEKPTKREMKKAKTKEPVGRSSTPMRKDKWSKKKKEKEKAKKKKKKKKKTAATLYAALDMVTPKNVLHQLDQIRDEESIVKLEIEDLIVSGNGQSEELLVQLSQFFFDGERQWQMINFKDNVGLNDLKAWLRSKREAMDFFEDLFREQPGILGFESLMFQAKMEVEEGTPVGNLFALFRNIKRQRRVSNVKVFMDEEEMDEEALNELFQEDSLGDNGELPETLVVLVTFGWMPDPEGLLLVDACLRMARDLGGLATSTHSTSAPALKRSSTDSCIQSSSMPFKRSSTHQGIARDRWAEEEDFPDPNQWFEEDAKPGRRRLNASGAREARRSVRAMRTSIRAPQSLLQNGRGRRQTQVSPARLRRQSRSNIQELQSQSTRQRATQRLSTPNIALGVRESKQHRRNSRGSSPNRGLGRRSSKGLISPYDLQDDVDSSSSSLHSSDLSSSGGGSGSDSDSSNDDSFSKEIGDVSIDESFMIGQSAKTNEEDAFGEVVVNSRRGKLRRSLSDRGLGFSSKGLASGRERSNGSETFASKKVAQASKSMHARRSVKALNDFESSDPLSRRAMMTKSASASSLVGKIPHNQRDKSGRSTHQRKNMRKNLNADIKVPSSHRRGPGGVGMARSASASSIRALDEDAAKSKANESLAATKSSRRGRRSIRDVALPATAARQSLVKSNSTSNLFGKLEWSKGTSKSNEYQSTSQATEEDASKSNSLEGSSPVIGEGENTAGSSQAHESGETGSANSKEIKVKRSISASSLKAASPPENGEPTGVNEANPTGMEDIAESAAGMKNDDTDSKASTATGNTKTTTDSSSKKNSGTGKVKRTISSGRKSVRVTRILDVRDPGPVASKADAKKKQPKRRNRSASRGPRSGADKPASSLRRSGSKKGACTRSSERVEKQAKATSERRREQGGKLVKATAVRRGVRRRHSDGIADLLEDDGAPSRKASAKRKTQLKKVSKESKKAIASREKWSSEMAKTTSDASESGTATTDDATAVSVTSLPQEKLRSLEKSLSESMLGLMDDSSTGTQEREEAESEAMVAKEKEVSEAIQSVLDNSFSFGLDDDSKDDEHNVTKASKVNEEEKQVSNIDTTDSNVTEEEEEEKSASNIVARGECNEGEKEVDAKDDNTDDEDNEKQEQSGSQMNLQRQSGMTSTPSEPTVEASSTSESDEPADEGEVADLESESASEDEEELEESLRVRKVLASAKRKKIDGLLGQLGSLDVANATCAA